MGRKGQFETRVPKRWHDSFCALGLVMPTFLLGCVVTYGMADVSNSTSTSALQLLELNKTTSSSSAKFPVNLPKIFAERSRNQLRMQMEGAVPKLITVQVDHTAYLHCFVENLGDKVVSWIRLKDMHLLTVMKYSYTQDDRFQAIHNEYTNDWMLQIRYVQLSDEGLYECQVNSNPPRSHYYRLKVVVPKAKILGGPDLHYGVGASVNLTCLITGISEVPTFVFWYFGEKMINYSPSRVRTTLEKAGVDTVISRLHLKEARPSDSGNYTCGPSNAEPTTVSVHVMEGGMPRSSVQNDAATPQRSAGVVQSAWPILLFLSFLIVLFLERQ